MNNSRVRKTLLVGVPILVMAGIGWYAWSQSKSKPSVQAGNSTSPWATYTSQQYGFKFDYLKQWGQPKVTAETSAPQTSVDGAPKVTKYSGTRYTVSFPDAQSDHPIMATLDSSDYSMQTCAAPNQCATVNAFTQADIKNVLSLKGSSQNSVAILSKDDSSYSSIRYSPVSGVLTTSRIVNLSKIKVNAASITFVLPTPSSNCKNNSLAANSSSGCITQSDYSNLSRFAKSIQNL